MESEKMYHVTATNYNGIELEEVVVGTYPDRMQASVEAARHSLKNQYVVGYNIEEVLVYDNWEK